MASSPLPSCNIEFPANGAHGASEGDQDVLPGVYKLGVVVRQSENFADQELDDQRPQPLPIPPAMAVTRRSTAATTASTAVDRPDDLALGQRRTRTKKCVSFFTRIMGAPDDSQLDQISA